MIFHITQEFGKEDNKNLKKSFINESVSAYLSIKLDEIFEVKMAAVALKVVPHLNKTRSIHDSLFIFNMMFVFI